jgi:hypothetical protein
MSWVPLAVAATVLVAAGFAVVRQRPTAGLVVAVDERVGPRALREVTGAANQAGLRSLTLVGAASAYDASRIQPILRAAPLLALLVPREAAVEVLLGAAVPRDAELAVYHAVVGNTAPAEARATRGSRASSVSLVQGSREPSDNPALLVLEIGDDATAATVMETAARGHRGQLVPIVIDLD